MKIGRAKSLFLQAFKTVKVGYVHKDDEKSC